MRGSPPLSTGDTIQDSQWMPKTLNNTEPCIYYSFSYTHTHDKVEIIHYVQEEINNNS